MTMKGNSFPKFIQMCKSVVIKFCQHHTTLNLTLNLTFRGKSLNIATFPFNVLYTLEVLEAINCFKMGCTAVLFHISSQNKLL